MSARIVVVHNDAVFLTEMATALAGAGYATECHVDPIAALEALEQEGPAQILITRVQFGPGKPHGIALARMARLMSPDVQIVFTARAEFAHEAHGLGVFLPTPVALADVVATVQQLMMRGLPTP